jgi:polyphosphate kinase
VKKSAARAQVATPEPKIRQTRRDVVKQAAVPEVDLHDPSLYVNRELALLGFQRRVLEEAEDPTNPLLERVKFLSILGSNLDEFFMIRVAGLIAQADAGSLEAGPDGMSPAAQLVAIRREVKKLMTEAHRCFATQLMPALAEAGIRILEYKELNERQCGAASRFFDETVFPVLTPLALDQGRPFPHISNLSLNLAVEIVDPEGGRHFARVKIPDSLPQLVPVNRIKRKHKHAPRYLELVWLEEIIAANLGALFPGMKVVEAYPFHLTRDADIAIKELEAEDLLETIEEGVRQRRFGSVVRMTVTPDIPLGLLQTLMSNLDIEVAQIFRVKGPLGLKRVMSLYQIDRPELKDPPFIAAVPAGFVPTSDDDDIFSMIRRHDVLVHHPFESFQPVIDLLKKSAHDPNVLAIKIVLYRVGRNAPVVEALLEAMEEGKQEAVLVELKARFDEESNIEWARKLEEEGVHVVYGLLGLKCHCKVAMVVRREGDAIRRYVHLATGNYNAVTAHLYTDLGLFTADERIADDATDLFNFLTGYSAKSDYQKLLVAPVNLRERMEALVQREIESHKKNGDGHLIFKMNSLVDDRMIRVLYRASQAGVKIQLLVRGACCLRPGLPGVSENIQVTSIVGRFLEHSRIYYFHNGGNEEIYLGSADLMQRNLNRRVEVLFPVEDPKLIHRVRDEMLSIYLADSVKARCMQSDGSYVRASSQNGKRPVNAQAYLLAKVRRSQD